MVGQRASRKVPAASPDHATEHATARQMDMDLSASKSKIAGREPMRINRGDALARGINDGNVVRVFNDRGSMLAGAVLSDDIRPGVIQISRVRGTTGRTRCDWQSRQARQSDVLTLTREFMSSART